MSLTGVDEDVIIAILVKRNNEQRQKIKVVYEASTGKVSYSLLMKMNSNERHTSLPTQEMSSEPPLTLQYKVFSAFRHLQNKYGQMM